MWKLLFSLLSVVCLSGCAKEPDIYRAEYLEKIFPDYKNDKTFIIKSNYFNKPTCQYLEHWAKEHIILTDKNIEEEYTFLKYSDEITSANPYLKKEYDAIVGDYEICKMSSNNYKCYICDK